MGGLDDFRRVRFALSKGEMAGVAWGDPTRPVDIVFLHANGFNALTYRRLLAPLHEKFHVLALDLRGHGRTSLSTRLMGYCSFNRHRDDVIEVLSRHVRAPVTLAGHSLGATAALLIAGKRGDLCRGVCLLEPVMFPPALYTVLSAPGACVAIEAAWPLAKAARRRRAAFESMEAAFTALAGRGVFASFAEESLRDYLTDGLVEKSDGGLALACAPAWEARTYAAQRHDPWAAWLRAPGPLVMLRSAQGSTIPDAAAKRAARLRPDARIATIEDASHMLPFERPDRARAAIETAMYAANRGGPRYRDLD